MRFYRSKGRVWTGTQADAKAAQGSADYETIEVPTDKPALLTFLNTFDLRPADAPAAPAIPPVTEETAEEIAEHIEAVARTPVVTVPQHSPSECPACLRSQRVAKLSANSEAVVCARADLEDVTDVRSLNEIIRLAEARIREIEAPTNTLELAPPVRARVRNRL